MATDLGQIFLPFTDSKKIVTHAEIEDIFL